MPLSAKPPQNSKDLIARAYMLCHACGDCLLDASKRVYACRACSQDLDRGDAVYFCLACKKAGRHPEHALERFRAAPEAARPDKAAMSEAERRAYLD